MCCERIPETDNEISIVGDSPFWANGSLQEILEPPVFDATIFSGSSISPETLRLIAQCNDTSQDDNPIRQYLGYFRIIESVYHSPHPNRGLESALAQSDNLRRVYSRFNRNESYEDAIKQLVQIRHKCAHLKLPRVLALRHSIQPSKLRFGPCFSW